MGRFKSPFKRDYEEDKELDVCEYFERGYANLPPARDDCDISDYERGKDEDDGNDAYDDYAEFFG